MEIVHTDYKIDLVVVSGRCTAWVRSHMQVAVGFLRIVDTGANLLECVAHQGTPHTLEGVFLGAHRRS